MQTYRQYVYENKNHLPRVGRKNGDTQNTKERKRAGSPPHGGSRYEKAEAGKRSASVYIFLEIGLQVFADAVSKGQFDLFSFYGNGDMGKTDLFKFFRYEFALVRNAAGVVRIGGKDHLPSAQFVISA